jgi:hypothetical protein
MSRSEIGDDWIPIDADDFDNPKKRAIIENAMTKQKNSKNNNSTINKGSLAYMSKDNVKHFNKELQNKLFNPSGIGRPYAFSSVEQLKKDMSEYFSVCDKYGVMPTITNLALWLNVNPDTLYEHRNNSNSPFSEIIKNTFNYLHSIMQDGTLAGEINPVTYIFLSKNYYGMRDDKNITVAATNNSGTPNAQETAEALQKQLQEEHITEATISEK